ncbi:aromatic ring-hydroxylating oxygenase subunit alpha [Sandaracinobacteroides saxicola]|uniref:Aromatic ring-hydroxylating dioxygenase subunit alpha n=1 Tax=Sandaracinobacteroides saxicola TaxID=2759707 RepID=A0A7G5IH44_9SPHN|nr:aromatic ring-hydroxylating dioxygenase subunit alpha [Sandaracinobacteroides saxicola]QMW22686.1 aromatic ring-hydroxylating dioxygenase subunit alpha [Sandaracinobacteroides saxicola]
MATQLKPATDPHADPNADWGLPGWAYTCPRLLAAETTRVLATAPQFVCHANDIPHPGDWRAVELLGESVLVVRGEDDTLRAFANVCRHRGHRLVAGAAGCAKRLICPYHHWAYALDGRLTGVPDSADYPTLDRATQGLVPLPLENWQGLLFVRLQQDADTPPVTAMLAPFAAEIAPDRLADLQPLGPPSFRPVAVNWKNVGDNYSDALHIRPAHPGLKRVFGHNYSLTSAAFVDRLGGPLERPGAGASWSERAYARLLPAMPHLPPERQRAWLYLKLWPNNAIEIYPDQIGLMQWWPTGPTTSLIRTLAYGLPDSRRETRAARYLNDRINRLVGREDKLLIESVQAGMASRFFTPGPLAATEPALRNFNARLRARIPELLNPEGFA